MFARRKFTLATLAGIFCAIGLAAAQTVPAPGEPVPDLGGETASGEAISLADFEGKPVVLEWTDETCPFVRKHYGTGNMQKLQRRLTEAGVVWISVRTGRAAEIGAEKAKQVAERNASYADYILLDPSGEIGRAFNARTTPQMVLIRGDGTLAYNGAIDDNPSVRRKTVDSAENYLLAAYKAVQDGEAVDPAVTKPYGCAVKY